MKGRISGEEICDEVRGSGGTQLIDREEITCDPTPRLIELHHAKAIRLELSKVYRDMRSGKIDPSDGTKLAYVLDMLRKSHETAVLQDRIELLELAAKLKAKK